MKKLSITLSAFTIILMLSYIFLNFSDIISNPSITGKPLVSTQLMVYSINESFCNQTFEAGWNLASFPCISDDLSIDDFLQYLNTTYELRTYDAADTPDPWKSYNPSLPSWVIQDLTMVSRAKGYWIHVNVSFDFFVNSSLRTPTFIDLEPGWTLIGYPSRNNQKVNDTFDQIIPNFDYVYLYNASDTDKWKQYTWNTSLPSVQDLEYSVMYYGYWIFMLAPDVLLIT